MFIHTFHIYSPILVLFSISDLHVITFAICVNIGAGRRAFLGDVNYITFTYVLWRHMTFLKQRTPW